MKKLLLATSILAATAGFAAAEVTLSGDARMGVIDDFGPTGLVFTSRARVKFTMSGETDGGLTFGANFRADNAGGASSGTAGEVFISGAFGTLTMGDIDGAAQQAVGNVDGVGLTGLTDLNEATYIAAGGSLVFGTTDPTAAYKYTAGSFTGIVSVTNPSGVNEATAVGVVYAMGDYTFAAGYESVANIDHFIIGANATFGAVTVKANYGRASGGGGSGDQMHISATYTADALAVTAFYGDDEEILGSKGYGLGASYDLGGGAKVVGGYAKNDSANTTAFDMGVSFSF
jgi:outer membrane protein OmpU